VTRENENVKKAWKGTSSVNNWLDTKGIVKGLWETPLYLWRAIVAPLRLVTGHQVLRIRLIEKTMPKTGNNGRGRNLKTGTQKYVSGSWRGQERWWRAAQKNLVHEKEGGRGRVISTPYHGKNNKQAYEYGKSDA